MLFIFFIFLLFDLHPSFWKSGFGYRIRKILVTRSMPVYSNQQPALCLLQKQSSEYSLFDNFFSKDFIRVPFKKQSILSFVCCCLLHLFNRPQCCSFPNPPSEEMTWMLSHSTVQKEQQLLVATVYGCCACHSFKLHIVSIFTKHVHRRSYLLILLPLVDNLFS